MTDQQGLAAPTLPTRDTSLAPPAATSPFAPPTPGPSGPTLAPAPLTIAPEHGHDRVAGQPLLPGSGPALPSPSATSPVHLAPPIPTAAPAPAPSGAETPTPKYRKKNKSFARRAMTLLVVLAVVAAVGGAAYLAYQRLAPTTDAPAAQLPLDDPDTLIGRSNELVTEINDNSEELAALDQLGLDATGVEEPAVPAPVTPAPPPESAADEPIAEITPVAAGAIGSFTYRYVDSPNLDATISVDIASGDFEFVSADSAFRRIDDTLYVSDADGQWTIVEGIDFAAVGVTGPISVIDVLPSAVEWYATSSSVTADGVSEYAIDRRQLAADAPDVLAAWLEPWGLADAGQASDEIRVELVADGSGLISSASISIDDPLRQVSYELTSTSDTALTIDVPAL